MAKMKVSIITVTYNNAATLADTIESVYQQTYQDIEYWIIDGASNDSTLDIIHENVERFQGRLHYISEPDKGIFDAMNKGIERCHGDIIGTLNADDYFTSDNIIEEVVKTFSKKTLTWYMETSILFTPTALTRLYAIIPRRSFTPFGFALVSCLPILHSM